MKCKGGEASSVRESLVGLGSPYMPPTVLTAATEKATVVSTCPPPPGERGRSLVGRVGEWA